MAIVGDLVKTQFAGGPSVIMGRSDGVGTTEAVVTGFNKVLFVFCSYGENQGDVRSVFSVESAGTVTFTCTEGMQFDFQIVGK